MARPKKEVIEMNEETEKIGKWANGLRIVCNILKVLDVIAVICLALVLIFVPKMMNEVKIDDEKIVVFDKTIEYSFKDVDFLTLKVDGKKEYTVNTKDVYKALYVDKISDIDMTKIRNVLMIDIVFVIAMCVLEFMILRSLAGLLKRTKEENVAFVEDGHKVLKNVLWLSIAIYVVQLVTGLCTAVVLSNPNIRSNINLDLGFVVTLCVLYFVSLLYKRGEELQNK